MNNFQLTIDNYQLKKGHKQTEVGVIPEDWEVKKLIEVVDYVDYRGKTPPKQESGITLVTARNIRDGFIDYESSQEYVSEAEYDKIMRRGKPEIGDILITTEAPLGNVAAVDNKNIALAQRVIKYRAKNKKLNQDYLKYYLLAEKFQRVLQDNSSGSTAQGIKGSLLHTLPIVIATEVEQRAIATALSDVDALITSLDKLIAKKRHLKTAAMQQLLTGKKRLPGFGEGKGYKQTEVGVIPEDWILNSLETVSAFITKGSTPTTYGFSWVKDGILFLRSECVSEDGLDLSQSMYISNQAHSALSRSEIRSGDLLITITGNVGRVIYLENNFGIGNINQHIARVRVVDENVCGKFIYFFLSQTSVRATFNAVTTGQAYPQISLKQVREAVIPLPSLSEQQLIATVLSDMDTEIAALEARRAKTQALKQGMMQELLTGKTRLIDNYPLSIIN